MEPAGRPGSSHSGDFVAQIKGWSVAGQPPITADIDIGNVTKCGEEYI